MTEMSPSVACGKRSQALRNRILKLKSNDAMIDETIFKSLQEEFLTSIGAVKSVSDRLRQRKQARKDQSIRLDWICEYEYLGTQINRQESDIYKTINSLKDMSTEVSPEEDNNQITILHDNINTSYSGYTAYKLNLQSLLIDIRELLKQNSQSSKYYNKSNDGFTETNRSALKAEYLLRIQEDLSHTWQQLQNPISELTDDLSSGHHWIATLLKNDTDNISGNHVTNSRSIFDDVDENPEIKLYMIDWHRRRDAICAQKDEELTALMCALKDSITTVTDINEEDLLTTGGWPVTDHDIFVKVLIESSRMGWARPKLTEQLRLYLPKYRLQDIAAHEDWHRLLKLYKEKRHACNNKYDKLHEALEVECAAERENIKVRRATTREMERRVMEHQSYQSLLHEKLVVLRATRQAEAAARELNQLSLDREDTQRRQAIEKREREIREQQKRSLQAFKEAQAEARRYGLAAREQALAATKEQQRQRTDKLRPRVQQRQEEAEKRRESERRMRLEEREREQARRTEILSRLASQVPYYEALQLAESRLEHITSSVRSHEYRPPVDPGRGFMSMHGFSDGTVVGDARFRLVAALRAAGVQNTNAAKDVIERVCPRPLLAIHGLL